MLSKTNLNRDQATESESDRPDAWMIREFADMFGVTARTVRFYEDKGLLSPERIGQSRMFHRQDRARFERILRGKRLGFSLDDMRAVFDVMEGRITDVSELRRHRDNFQAVIDGLADRRRDVELLSEDMGEIIAVIDAHLENNSDVTNQDVSSLADRYQAAFKIILLLNKDQSNAKLQGSRAGYAIPAS